MNDTPMTRLKPHIRIYDGVNGPKFYLTITKNGTPFNKMYDTLEEAERELEFIQKTQLVKGFSYPDKILDILFGDRADVDIDFIESEFEENFLAILDTLTEREKYVMQARHISGYTLESVGLQLGVTRERVRQIEAKALRKLKHPSRLAKMRYGKKVFELQDDIKKLTKELQEEKMKLRRSIANVDLTMLEKDDDFLQKHIADFDFSVRTYNSLRRGGIKTFGELISKTKWELLSLRNLGRKSFREIEIKVNDLGYRIYED